MKRMLRGLVILLTALTASMVFGMVPSAVNYQGYLTDDEGTPLDTTVAMTFKFYSFPSTLLWTEIHPAVTVTDGLFEVALGEIVELPDSVFRSELVYLGISVGSDAQMSPRTEVRSVPYSRRVGTVDGASGGWIREGLSVGGINSLTNGGVFVAGNDNTVSESGGSIAGGGTNTVSGVYGFIGAGVENVVNSAGGVCGGGYGNSMTSNGSSNTIGGGYHNLVEGSQSNATIAGGGNNLAAGQSSAIGGGEYNIAHGNYSVISGGGGDVDALGNVILPAGEASVSGGGRGNEALAANGFIGGVNENQVSGSNSVIGGGNQNSAAGSASFVGGGDDNHVSGARSVLVGGETNAADGDYAFVGGGMSNDATGDYSVVAGGENNDVSGLYAAAGGGASNLAAGSYSVVGGGLTNRARGDYSVVAGGGGPAAMDTNTASALGATVSGGGMNLAAEQYATVGGGYGNMAEHLYATIAGGSVNWVSGPYSTIGGGVSNVASGYISTVPGGVSNVASGRFAFACGRNARAIHDGSFVWADSAADNFYSSYANEFSVRAAGGVRLYTNAAATLGVRLLPNTTAWSIMSDSTKKTDIRPVDTKSVLEKIAVLPLAEWRYKEQPDPAVRHIGPMAQDFWNAFRLGEDSLSISTIDPDGIALAAIQELAKENQALRERNRELTARLDRLETRFNEMTEMQSAQPTRLAVQHKEETR